MNWPQFRGMFSTPRQILNEVDIWYDAFEQFVGSTVQALGVEVLDETVVAWLQAIGREPTFEEMKRTIIEGYFSNIIHELAISPSVAGMVSENKLYLATRASRAPAMIQSAFVNMLVTGTTGGTTRFHATHNHPWSHFTDPTLLQCVSVFQAAISAVPKESPIHPSKVETSVAW